MNFDFTEKKREMEQQQTLEVLLGLTWSSKASLKKGCPNCGR